MARLTCVRAVAGQSTSMAAISSLDMPLTHQGEDLPLTHCRPGSPLWLEAFYVSRFGRRTRASG